MGVAVIMATFALGLTTNADSSDKLRGSTWTRAHLGAQGLAKCQAYRRVRMATTQLQQAGGGTITTVDRRRLERQLAAARRLPPRALTPFQCGVPL
jgi:hypothetical protein